MNPMAHMRIARHLISVPALISYVVVCTNALAADPLPIQDGSSKLSHSAKGPAPKPAFLSDGKPNWTGFWVPAMFYIGDKHDEVPVVAPKADAPPRSGPQVPIPAHAPLKSPFKEKYEHDLAIQMSGVVVHDSTALCVPPGMPSMMGAIYGLEVLQTPGQITLTAEWPGESRRIWTDGRQHPKADDLLDTYAGHSVGRWEGNVLVVDTVGLRSDTRIDQSGLPHDENMHLTERFSSTTPGILVDEITIDDPTVYEGPWKVTHQYRYRPDLNLEEYVCEENNRNVGENGEPEFGSK